MDSGFTDRQREVIELIAEGLTNREIAKRLYITQSVVEQHITRAGQKVGVSGRKALVDYLMAQEG